MAPDIPLDRPAPGRIRLLPPCRGGDGAATAAANDARAERARGPTSAAKRLPRSRARPRTARQLPRPAHHRASTWPELAACRPRRSGISAAGGSSRVAGSAIVRNTRNGMPSGGGGARDDDAFEIDREGAGLAPGAALVVLGGENGRGRRAPGPRSRRSAAPTRVTSRVEPLLGPPAPVLVRSTSVERTTSPGRRCGARAPAMPKLTRHLACGPRPRPGRRCARVAGADDHREAGGARDSRLRGETGGAEHRCQCAHAQLPSAARPGIVCGSNSARRLRRTRGAPVATGSTGLHTPGQPDAAPNRRIPTRRRRG